MFDEAGVHTGEALFQAFVEFQLDPHAEEDCHGITNKPAHAQPKQGYADLLAEQDGEENHEGGEDPHDQDSFVKDVVHCESHVCCQLLHRAHIFFNCQLKMFEIKNL